MIKKNLVFKILDPENFAKFAKFFGFKIPDWGVAPRTKNEPKTKIHFKSPGGILVLGFLVWGENAFRMHSSISSVDAKVAKVANITSILFICIIPVVPHKAVAEVSKIGNL